MAVFRHLPYRHFWQKRYGNPGLVPALDLALGLRMARDAAQMAHLLGTIFPCQGIPWSVDQAAEICHASSIRAAG